MRDSAAFADGRVARESARGLRILARGAMPIDRRAIAEVVRAILGGDLPEIARDRNAICYRATLARRAGVPAAVIVKTPRFGPQRTNADATFSEEAQVLARLPAAGIAFAPALIARVVVPGEMHFLFVSELAGAHPHPQRHRLDVAQLRGISDALYEMDCRGFMHYDLKAANVLVHGARAAFVDFEFACFGEPWGAGAPREAAYCEDFNVANNPFVRARSNVANFEFRCLHRYLAERSGVAPEDAAALLRGWLAAKSAYHARMARGLAGRAAAHERRLARLFADPPDAVIGVERLLMAFRTAIFERDAPSARRCRRAMTLACRSRRSTLPLWYANAAMRIVDLVSRSVHPQS